MNRNSNRLMYPTMNDAHEHLGLNPFVRQLRKPLGGGIVLAVAALGLLFVPALCDLVIGLAAAYIVVVLAYLAWQWWFTCRQRIYRIHCPACNRHMWELACKAKSCGKRVPPLALFLRGAFLSHCPHCHMPMAAADHTLVAACPGPHRFVRPDRLYKGPIPTMVWIVPELPSKLVSNSGWIGLTKSGDSRLTMYYSGDGGHTRVSRRMAVVHFVRADHMLGGRLPLGQETIERTRLLLLSRDVVQRYGTLIGQIEGHFDPSRTEVRRLS